MSNLFQNVKMERQTLDNEEKEIKKMQARQQELLKKKEDTVQSIFFNTFFFEPILLILTDCRASISRSLESCSSPL